MRFLFGIGTDVAVEADLEIRICRRTSDGGGDKDVVAPDDGRGVAGPGIDVSQRTFSPVFMFQVTGRAAVGNTGSIGPPNWGQLSDAGGVSAVSGCEQRSGGGER